jgi:hypothetical protein
VPLLMPRHPGGWQEVWQPARMAHDTRAHGRCRMTACSRKPPPPPPRADPAAVVTAVWVDGLADYPWKMDASGLTITMEPVLEPIAGNVPHSVVVFVTGAQRVRGGGVRPRCMLALDAWAPLAVPACCSVGNTGREPWRCMGHTHRTAHYLYVAAACPTLPGPARHAHG